MRGLVAAVLLALSVPAHAGDIADVLKFDIALRGLWAFEGTSPWRIESIVLLRPLNAGLFSRLWAHDLLTMDWSNQTNGQPWKINNKLTVGIDLLKIEDAVRFSTVYQLQTITAQPTSQRIGLEVRY